MRKLLSFMIGLGLVLGSGSFAFAQEEKKGEEKKAEEKKKGKKKKKGEEKKEEEKKPAVF